MNGLVQSIVLGLVRSAAVGAGAWLVKQGYVDQNMGGQIAGSLICLAGAGFGIFDKFVADSKIKTAAGLPAPLPVSLPPHIAAAAEQNAIVAMAAQGRPVTMAPIPDPPSP